MSTPEELLAQYGGHVVPFSFSPGFVALSYCVSLVGAMSTLELISRRTSHKGIYNQYDYRPSPRQDRQVTD